MNFLWFDCETFWDGNPKDPFTLSKLPTEEYVRSSRFEIILVGVAVNDEPPEWFSGTHDEIRDYLVSKDFENSMVVCHNSMFDLAIASWCLDLRPKLIGDTLSMARPIHGAVRPLSLAKLSEHYNIGTKGDDTRWAQGLRRRDFSPEQLREYAGYCATRPDSDVNLTRRLFKILLPLTPKRELALIDATIRLFTEPRLVLDRPLLEEQLSRVRAQKMDWLLSLGGSPEEAKKNLMSNEKFAALLLSHGVEPPRKVSAKTGKEAWAFAKTDQGMTELLEHEDPAVQTLAAARLGTKSTIEETRTATLIGVASRGAFPIPLAYCGATTTMRWAGIEKINTQNFPRGGVIRKAIMAPPGQVVLVGDSSNIELRVNHTLAGQANSVDSFRAKRDLYCEFATTLYGRTITKDDKDERFLGKLCIAEGSLVLTDTGLVPIEQVTTIHRVWDGVDWVHHGGVVCNGETEVITYDEITATPDHLVYLQDGISCRLEEAARSAHRLARTGDGRTAIRLGSNFVERGSEARECDVWESPVCPVWHGEVDKSGQSGSWDDERMSAMQPTATNSDMAYRSCDRDATTLHEPERPVVLELRGSGDRIPLSFGAGGVPLYPGNAGSTQASRTRSDRQQRALRSGESSVCVEKSQLEQSPTFDDPAVPRTAGETPGSALRGRDVAETAVQRAHGGAGHRAMAPAVVQTKRRVWDILNAGPRHRFTVSGRLVSNCHLSLGYGAGFKKFREMCRLQKVDITEERAKEIVDLWRQMYSRVPAWWRQQEQAFKAMSLGSRLKLADGLLWTWREGDVCGYETAGGTRIRYHDFFNDATDGWTYNTRKGRKRLWIGAAVENISQHLARNIIAEQWLVFQTWCQHHAPAWRVVLQVHDELVAVGPESEAPVVAEALEKIMSTSPKWWPAIPLAAEVGYAQRYGEAKA